MADFVHDNGKMQRPVLVMPEVERFAIYPSGMEISGAEIYNGKGYKKVTASKFENYIAKYLQDAIDGGGTKEGVTNEYDSISHSDLFDIYYGKEQYNPGFGLRPVVSLSSSKIGVDISSASNNGSSSERPWRLIKK